MNNYSKGINIRTNKQEERNKWIKKNVIGRETFKKNNKKGSSKAELVSLKWEKKYTKCGNGNGKEGS